MWRLQSWIWLSWVCYKHLLHATSTHRIRDTARRRAFCPSAALLLLAHLSQQRIKHPRWPSLVVLRRWLDLPLPHASVCVWKSFVRASEFSPGNTYNYSPLSGSLRTHRPWQVSLPVDMCHVGGQHFNVVSTAILDSSYFAPKTVSKSLYFIEALPKNITYQRSERKKQRKTEQYAASRAKTCCVVTPTDNLCEQLRHIERIIRNMQEASSLVDTGAANVKNIFASLFSVFRILNVFLKVETRITRQVFILLRDRLFLFPSKLVKDTTKYQP